MFKYIPHAAAATLSLTLVLTSVSAGAQTHEPQATPTLKAVESGADETKLTQEARAKLDDALKQAHELLTPTVDTDAVKAAEANLKSSLDKASTLLPGEVRAFTGGVSLDANRAPAEAEARMGELKKLSDELVAVRESEAARLAAEEEARKREEAAARQAAAAAAAASPQGTTSRGSRPKSQGAPQSGGAPASAAPSQDKVGRAVASLGFVSIPVVQSSGTCPSRAYGCYVPGGGTIYITPLGMGQSHCGLRKTIAHEYKHYLQELEGWLRNGEGMTLEEIEAEAYAFGGQYAC